jgi:hypothetical protein
MTKRIIYKNANEGVSVIVPAPQSEMTLAEIAAKDVPAGHSYKIVDVSEVPTDRTDRDLWRVDESDLTDGVGANYGVLE